MGLDAKQILLLEELFHNSRISAISLSKNLQTSRQSAAASRNELWATREIYSPTILINPNSLKSYSYFIFISVNNLQNPQIEANLLGFSEVTMMNVLIGEKTIMSKLWVQTRKRFIEILKIFDGFIDDGIFTSYKVIEPFGIFKIGGFVLKSCAQMYHLTDRRWHLLQLLKKNNNIRKWPMDGIKDPVFLPQEIAYLKKINLPRELDRFEKEGIIQNYSIILQQPVSTFATKYLIRMKPKRNSDYQSLIGKLVKNPNMIEIYRVGEELGIFGIYCCNGDIPVQEIVGSLYDKYEIQATTTDLIIAEYIRPLCPPTADVSAKISNYSPDDENGK